MVPGFIKKYGNILVYGLSLAALFFLLRFLEWQFILINHAFEIYVVSIALLFTILGIWLARKLARPVQKIKVETVFVEKELLVEKQEAGIVNEVERQRLGLSNREMDVLHLMADGLSNQEIAGKLFVSLNTVKTHCSKLFEKMDVKRRTQAIEKAKRLRLID